MSGTRLRQVLTQFPAPAPASQKRKGASGFELTALVLNRQFASPTQQHVMAALADYMCNGTAYPSAAALAAKTGWTRRTVQKCLSELERQGLLTTIDRKPCSKGMLKVRRIELAAVEALPKIPTAAEREKHKRGARGSPPG
ncbi:MAG: helix-turn-helix domain-containing protein [Terricaulis sp.]|jgi:pyocin large subunit-like protein